MFDEFKKDLWKTWYIIKSILDVSNNKNIIKCNIFNNVEYIDELSIAHILNSYLGEVASNLTVLLTHFPSYHLMNPLCF